MLYALADRLGKSIGEVERMTVGEIAEWYGYFRIRNREMGR